MLTVQLSYCMLIQMLDVPKRGVEPVFSRQNFSDFLNCGFRTKTCVLVNCYSRK